MILVTGAGGRVGSSLIRELQGRAVRGAYHSPHEDPAGVLVDYGNPASLDPALNGVSDVFLLGAMSPHQTAHELAIVRAAERAGVQRIVKLSVWRADEQLTPIARLHRPVERALERSDMAWTLLRPNFYMQNFARDLASASATGALPQPASDAPISFVDTRDIARVAAHVLTTPGHDGRIYPVTGPEALTYADVADVLSGVLGHPIRYLGLDDDQARAWMLDRGAPRFTVDALLDVAAAYRHGGCERVEPTVRNLTGREATSLATWAAEDREALFRA